MDVKFKEIVLKSSIRRKINLGNILRIIKG